MAYEFLSDPTVLVRRFNSFVFGPGVPDVAAERLQSIPGTAADVISEGAELLYAHRDLLNEDGLTVMAQLGAYGVSQAWSTFNKDGRWDQIVAHTRKALGERVKAPADKDMPEPQVARREDGTDWRMEAASDKKKDAGGGA